MLSIRTINVLPFCARLNERMIISMRTSAKKASVKTTYNRRTKSLFDKWNTLTFGVEKNKSSHESKEDSSLHWTGEIYEKKCDFESSVPPPNNDPTRKNAVEVSSVTSGDVQRSDDVKADSTSDKEVSYRAKKPRESDTNDFLKTSLLNPSKSGKVKIEYDKPIKFGKAHVEVGTSFPSVSRILKETMSQESRLALQKWEEKMIRELGIDGFKEMTQRMFERGHRLHRFVERRLLGEPQEEETDDEISLNHIKSVSVVIEKFSKPFAIESHVVHPHLRYQGYLDSVALYQGSTLALIEWKTSERKKRDLKSTYDNPLQVAAYVGALNHDNRYNIQITDGLIVMAYNDGSPADVLKISSYQMSINWSKWLERVKLYEYNKMKEYETDKGH